MSRLLVRVERLVWGYRRKICEVVGHPWALTGMTVISDGSTVISLTCRMCHRMQAYRQPFRRIDG